ncbi:MerR family transcriptional regulator [Streptosporangiaceae bacterium NEAU-GS5]|nr:MerR family transcriptional regulator [Streptosporangiaceae bacterium NEAU-GS5]
MQIGDLARLSGASRRSIRHYEAAGLLTAHRRVNGYRDYDDDAVDRVAKIKALLTAGLTLADIGPLLSCVVDDQPTLLRCERTIAAVERTVSDLDRRIGELSGIRSLLVRALPD